MKSINVCLEGKRRIIKSAAGREVQVDCVAYRRCCDGERNRNPSRLDHSVVVGPFIHITITCCKTITLKILAYNKNSKCSY